MCGRCEKLGNQARLLKSHAIVELMMPSLNRARTVFECDFAVSKHNSSIGGCHHLI